MRKPLRGCSFVWQFLLLKQLIFLQESFLITVSLTKTNLINQTSTSANEPRQLTSVYLIFLWCLSFEYLWIASNCTNAEIWQKYRS